MDTPQSKKQQTYSDHTTGTTPELEWLEMRLERIVSTVGHVGKAHCEAMTMLCHTLLYVAGRTDKAPQVPGLIDRIH